MNIFTKIKNKFIKTKSPQIAHYSWIVYHTRATDRVFFGPFSSYKELDAFFDDPKNKDIQCGIELLISPNCPKEQYWYNPNDYLLENHPYLFQRDS
jgi:hypothetical protein